MGNFSTIQSTAPQGGPRCSEQPLLLRGMKGIGKDGSQCIFEAAQRSLNSDLLVRFLYTPYGLNHDVRMKVRIRRGLFHPKEM